MKTKKIAIVVLVALGFGSAIGLGSCARRAQKGQAVEKPAQTADSTGVGWDTPRGEPDVRVMYGAPRPTFDPQKPVRRLDGVGSGSGSSDTPTESTPPAPSK